MPSPKPDKPEPTHKDKYSLQSYVTNVILNAVANLGTKLHGWKSTESFKIHTFSDISSKKSNKAEYSKLVDEKIANQEAETEASRIRVIFELYELLQSHKIELPDTLLIDLIYPSKNERFDRIRITETFFIYSQLKALKIDFPESLFEEIISTALHKLPEQKSAPDTKSETDKLIQEDFMMTNKERLYWIIGFVVLFLPLLWIDHYPSLARLFRENWLWLLWLIYPTAALYRFTVEIIRSYQIDDEDE